MSRTATAVKVEKNGGKGKIVTDSYIIKPEIQKTYFYREWRAARCKNLIFWGIKGCTYTIPHNSAKTI